MSRDLDYFPVIASLLAIIFLALVGNIVFNISSTKVNKCEKVTAYIPVSGKWITREICLNE